MTDRLWEIHRLKIEFAAAQFGHLPKDGVLTVPIGEVGINDLTAISQELFAQFPSGEHTHQFGQRNVDLCMRMFGWLGASVTHLGGEDYSFVHVNNARQDLGTLA